MCRLRHVWRDLCLWMYISVFGLSQTTVGDWVHYWIRDVVCIVGRGASGSGFVMGGSMLGVGSRNSSCHDPAAPRSHVSSTVSQHRAATKQTRSQQFGCVSTLQMWDVKTLCQLLVTTQNLLSSWIYFMFITENNQQLCLFRFHFTPHFTFTVSIYVL